MKCYIPVPVNFSRNMLHVRCHGSLNLWGTFTHVGFYLDVHVEVYVVVYIVFNKND